MRTVSAAVAVRMKAGPAVQGPAAAALAAVVSTQGMQEAVALAALVSTVGKAEQEAVVSMEGMLVALEAPVAKAAAAATALVAPSARMAVKTPPVAKVTAPATVKATGRVTAGMTAKVMGTVTMLAWVRKTEMARPPPVGRRRYYRYPAPSCSTRLKLPSGRLGGPAHRRTWQSVSRRMRRNDCRLQR
jgi:hypothetical protein